MKCPNCGKVNESNAKFCEECGKVLNKVKRYNKKPLIFILVGAMIMFTLAISYYFVSKNTNEKKFTEMIAQADRFVEEKNYEQAEDYYLKAIEIDPKHTDSYIKLSDVYIAQGKNDDAVKILETAKKEITDEEDKKKIEKAKETASSLASYSWEWEVNPDIEADDIFYLNGLIGDYPNSNLINNLKIQFRPSYIISPNDDSSPYVVIKKDNKYSLINMSGKLIDDYLYNDVSLFSGKYVLKRIEPKYESQYHQKTTTYYLNDNNKLEPLGGIGGIDTANYYYYNNGIQSSKKGTDFEKPVPLYAIPIQQQDDNSTTFDPEKKYAIYKEDKLVTDFIFEDCGSYSNGLIAAKKDGKWGYINDQGETIIPFEYDSSWQITTDSASVLEPLKGEYTTTDFAYGAQDEFINLNKDGVWELRTIHGDLVIAPGVFEKINPVDDDKCWVKKDGKWGVISIKNKNMLKIKNGDEVTLTGTLETVKFRHPYGFELSNLVFESSTPVEITGTNENPNYVSKPNYNFVAQFDDKLNLPEGQKLTLKGNINLGLQNNYYLYDYCFDINSIIQSQ